jgi:uncharacterized protein (DUF849 family)
MNGFAEGPAAGMPFIVLSAPNGARRSKSDHAQLPVTAAEIAMCAEQVVEAGAAVLHLHVRDADGRHTLDAEPYRAAIAAVRERVGDRLVIQATTEACGRYSREEQIAAVIELQPEAVSIALRELCPDEDSEQEAAAFFAWLRANGILPQYILYSPDEVARFEDLRRRGVFAEEQPFVLFVLGRYTRELRGDPGDLGRFRAALGQDSPEWSVCCFGAMENDAAQRAAAAGGHARVGFENNLCLPDGSPAMNNADLVRLAAGHARASQRTLATAHDVRDRFA